jgi:SAM-dependent methyltransferase
VTFKDLFSLQAADYARFRPAYPPALFGWLAAQAGGRRLAVDVGTGNGQAAVALAAHFDHVIGVEPSDGQLANATPAPNVEYRRGAAEATGVDADAADLLASAQAFHWFKHDAFFAEARRVIRRGGCLAVWCYGLAHITPEVDAAVLAYYEDMLGPYWEPERRLVENGYRDVPVPFDEITPPPFEMRLSWSLAHLVGYLGTWSPRKRYREAHGRDPLELALPRLEQAWGSADAASERPVIWPLSVRAFRL